MEGNMEIKSKIDGKLIFKDDGATIKLTVEAAVKLKIYMQDANMQGAYMQGTDMRGANMQGAYMQGAYMRYADMRYADMRGADMRGAYMLGANMRDAIIKDGVKLKAKTSILQCGPAGSRQDYIIIFNTDIGLYVKAGCFLYTLDKFVLAVKTKHGGTVYEKEYLNILKMAKAHFKLWNK